MSKPLKIEDRKPSQRWTQTPDQFIAAVTKNGEDHRAIYDHLEQVNVDDDAVFDFCFDRNNHSEGHQRIWALVNRKVAIIEFQYDKTNGIEAIKVFILRK